MPQLIIISDDENKKSYNLRSHEITVDNDKLILTLNTDKQTIQYEISVDSRARDLDDIRGFISEQLRCSYTTDVPFTIYEFLRRWYISVGEDGNCRQFTAYKKSL